MCSLKRFAAETGMSVLIVAPAVLLTIFLAVAERERFPTDYSGRFWQAFRCNEAMNDLLGLEGKASL